MKTADIIAEVLTLNNYSAVTLAGGYAVRTDGTRYLFPPCRARECKRNAKGRCTKLTGTYYDGSAIVYTWSEERGPRYKAQDSHKYPDNED